MHAPIAQNVLLLLEISGYAVLILKLWRSGLHRDYPFFFAYLSFRVIQITALYLVPFNSTLYARVWFGSEPLSWILYVLVVLELYSLIVRGYRGIASLGRWVLMGALFVSITLSAITLRFDLSNPAEQFPVILYFTAISRGVFSSLVIFLLLIAAFLAVYPVPLNRNIIVHAIACALYFLSTSMSFLVRNITGAGVNVAVNLVLTAITICALTVWIVFLNRAGERKAVILHQHWRPADEEQLLEQLGTINATLLRVARK